MHELSSSGSVAVGTPGSAGASADVRASQRGSSGAMWAKGAEGERIVGQALETACAGIGHVLHDRRLPGSKRNIDHVVVTGAGVFVVDAKNVKGTPRFANFGGTLTTDERLCIGRMDQTMMVEGVQSLGAAVREISKTEVTSVLCFVGQNVPLNFTVRGVLVTDEMSLGKIVQRAGVLTPQMVSVTAGLLASALRSA
jgi:Nuclease-related domain